MRSMMLSCAMLAMAVPMHAQQLGVFGASAVPRTVRATAYGAGVSIGGSFTLGAIMAEANPLSRSKRAMVARLSISELHAREGDYALCVDDCPPRAHDVRLRMQMVHASLHALPYRTSVTRVELGVGIAIDRQVRRTRDYDMEDSSWGFTLGGALARRLGGRTWLRAGYDRHARPLKAYLQDDPSLAPPVHSFHLGLTFRGSE